MQQRHIIQKQVIEVEAGTAMDGMAFQREVNSWNERLMPALESLFDQYAQDGRHILIEKLNVNVEMMMGDDWVDAVIKQIVRQLPSPSSASVEESISVFHSEQSAPARLVEQWLYFLEHGHLPWYGVAADIAEEVKLAEAIKLTAVSATSKIEQIRLLLAKPSPRKRLINQFSEKFVVEVIRVLSKKNLVQQVIKQIGKKYTEVKLTRVLLDVMLQCVIQNKTSVTEISLALQPHLQPAKPAKPTGKVRPAKPVDEETTSHKNLPTEEEPTRSNSNKTGSIKPNEPQTSERSEAEKQTELIKKIFSTSNKKDRSQEEIEGIYIENAGLIITAPFISNFLQHCGLMKDGALTSPSQAAYLLQTLVTGLPEPKEYDLSLNKIFCGLDVSFVLDPYEPITPEQSAEAEQLLSAIIKYWTIIKNTSIEGLRESFLQRNGKLSRKSEHEWLLQVEQKSYDMLLEHLPWTISMIRLPFMQCTLIVEWM